MVVPTRGFADLNGRGLGMPEGPVGTMTKGSSLATSELYVPAGDPLTLNYLSSGAGSYMCAMSKSFIPVEGKDYEAFFVQEGRDCRSGVSLLDATTIAIGDNPVPLADAKLCKMSDIF